MFDMKALQEKAHEISGVFQIFALVQPMLLSLFQYAETMFPVGGGSTKMQFIKTCISNALNELPQLQADFEKYWKMLVGIIEAALVIAKAAGLLKPPVAPTPAPTPAP